MMAEESTSWPQVSRPVHIGGLGFDLKWNMGWMNDTLSYFSHEPIHRKYHHNDLTFSMLYAFTENFLLPFSHDEVVHGKQSMLHKMPGDEWQKFANLRTIYTYMFTHPGKKLLFMGTEFGQGLEWNSAQTLDWYVLDYAFHQGVKHLVQDLNRLYHQSPSLYTNEFEWQGFEWLDCHDSEQSILSFARKNGNDDIMMMVFNFTPVPRNGYRIGVTTPGTYEEIFNSDSKYYGGSNMGNGGRVLVTDDIESLARVSVSGLAFRLKQRPFYHNARLTGAIHRPFCSLTPIGNNPHITGILDGQDVRLEDGQGVIISQRTNAKNYFSSAWKLFSWDDLDMAYFANYAFWNSLILPALLMRTDILWEETGPGRLKATFNERIPTHCRVQRFNFDPDTGHLQQHNYSADVISKRARAANVLLHHSTTPDGVVYPSVRRVTPRGLKEIPCKWPVLIAIAVHDFNLFHEAVPGSTPRRPDS